MAFDSPLPTVVTWGSAHTIAACNDAYVPLLGDKPEPLGRSMLDVWPEAATVIGPQLDAALAGETVWQEGATFALHRHGRRDEASFDYAFSPLRDDSGQISGTINVAIETTERHAAERALQASERREAERRAFLETLLDNAEVCVAVMQGEALRYTLVNAAYARLQPGVEMVGRSYAEVFSEAEAAGAGDTIRRVMATGETVVENGYHGPIPGKPDARWDHRLVRLPFVDNEAPSVLVITADVTHHWRAIVAERRAREERDLLLREVFHRVNNNLQTVAALISMERRRFDDPQVHASFDRMTRRTNAMGLVHRKLMASERLGEIDLGDLLESLCAALAEAMGAESRGLELSVTAERLVADIDFAMPLGLIVNELVLNAAEHAYPQMQPGGIAVRLRSGASRWVLEVEDEGMGLDGAAPDGSGGRIVRALVAQLKGEIDSRSPGKGAGTTHRIALPAPDRGN
jgi:two-component sensor histidine kinase